MANTINGTATGQGGLITTGDNTDELQLQTGETTALTIDSSQRVGVGVTPSAWGSVNKVMQVNGSALFSNGLANCNLSSNLYVDESAVTKSLDANYAVQYTQAFDGTHRFYTSSAAAGSAGATVTMTERLRIDASGNVGIGTSTPGDELEIYASNSTPRLRFTGASSVASGVQIGLVDSTNGVISNTENGYLLFGTNNAERMRIDSSGNVGIGTSTPGSFVVVEKSSNSGSGGAFPRLSIKNSLATQGDGSSTFNFSDLNISSGNEAVNMFLATTYAAGAWEPSGQLNVATNHPLIFKTNGTERLRILAGGGITFNGDTAAANALDDYEEGTWTPVLSDGTNTLNLTGTYTKIGRVVRASILGYNVNVTSLTASAQLRFTGLPFSVATALYVNALMAQRTPLVSGIAESLPTTTMLLYSEANAVDYNFFTRNTWGGASNITFRSYFVYETST